jgi:ribosomal protein L44E
MEGNSRRRAGLLGGEIMGQFIDQVQRNNALQQQQLTLKQQERKAKEEKQKELARIKRQKQREADALQELDQVINATFEKATTGQILNRKLTPTQCNYILQQLEHRNGIITDVSKGRTATAYYIEKHYNATLQRIYKKYLQDEQAKKELQEINNAPPQTDNKTTTAYKTGVLLKHFTTGLAGVTTILTACIIGIFWGLFDISKK